MKSMWVRLDSTFPSNPKVLRLLDAKRHRAIVLYTFGLAYAGHQDTDGYVPAYALPILSGTTADARHLVDVGLWREVEGGYLIHGWAEYQPSAEHKARVRAGLDKARCTKAMRTGQECTCGQH